MTGLAAECPGRPADGRARLPPGPEAREPGALAFPLAVAGVAPVPQRPRELVKPGAERLLGALAPPRRGLVLGGVPFLAQRARRPRASLREAVPGTPSSGTT